MAGFISSDWSDNLPPVVARVARTGTRARSHNFGTIAHGPVGGGGGPQTCSPWGTGYMCCGARVCHGDEEWGGEECTQNCTFIDGGSGDTGGVPGGVPGGGTSDGGEEPACTLGLSVMARSRRRPSSVMARSGRRHSPPPAPDEEPFIGWLQCAYYTYKYNKAKNECEREFARKCDDIASEECCEYLEGLGVDSPDDLSTVFNKCVRRRAPGVIHNWFRTCGMEGVESRIEV